MTTQLAIEPDDGLALHEADGERCFYAFADGRADGSRDLVSELGGKGAGLAEMMNLGVPVPPGFTIACRLCDAYLRTGVIPDAVVAGLHDAVAFIERAMGRGFGDVRDPLLVSVRSGAAVSMPGMLETVLNLGLNDRTTIGLATRTNNARFAYDSYRRFIQMYGSIVLGVAGERFEALLGAARAQEGAATDSELGPEALLTVIAAFKALIKEETGAEVPQDPYEQLLGAIKAVWSSWTLKKAVDYRRVHGIADSPGTAVSVVAMVFGNCDEESGTGVAFTRDPSTGAPGPFGEFLPCAQGEDVVAGIRTPLPIAEMERRQPRAHAALMRVMALLERHYRDMQDIEFTVQSGTLYVLQTRSGKRAAAAAVRIAHDLVSAGLIGPNEAVQRVTPAHLQQLLHSVVDASALSAPLCTGLPASPGAGSGVAVFDADTAEQRAARGEPVVLVRDETTPDDFHGIVAAQAIVTARGGMTSHAAVVARGMGKCAVVGCTGVTVDAAARTLACNGRTAREGDWITVDGAAGRVFLGRVPTAPSQIMRVLSGEADAASVATWPGFRDVLAWADEASRMTVRANADTPRDAMLARRAGAQGIGLCRTEHMFFEGDRIGAMRQMIVARSSADRRLALARILPMQRDDFERIFTEMSGLPVTIRLLDPPLHEFLPRAGADVDVHDLATSLGLSADEFRNRVESLRETNPMLGHRGCRLGVTYPEITEMQARAIFQAAKAVRLRGGDVRPEIMVPLIATLQEFEHQRAIIDDVAQSVLGSLRQMVPYQVGVMIELPRAALIAGAIAERADFFSFGTNDLTQTTLGLSRDDAGRFLPSYVERGVLPDDPFTTIDVDGVGALVAMAAHRGRAVKPSLKLGVCGEHGGDPASVGFFHTLGLDYVSCSPYRVPMARLAAAQAALASQR